VIVLDPVVNHPHPATLAAALHGVTQLADAAPTFDDVAALWIFCQFGLQPSVRIVGEQRCNQARKCWGFDEFHDVILSANGGHVNLFHDCLSDVSEKQGDVPSFLLLFTPNLLDYTIDERSNAVVSGSMTESVKFAEEWTWARPAGTLNWKLEGIEVVRG